MNLKQLRFVREVARTRSFSQAAEHCFATQPTLSNAVAQLEKELGERLFIRTTRRVEPTPFGEYLLPFIESLLTSQDELVKAAKAFHNPAHKMLRIGFSPLVDMRLLHQALAPFRRANPDVELFFKECFVDELEARLRNEQIDVLAMVSRPRIEGESARPFYRDTLHYLPAAGDRQGQGRLAYLIDELPATPIILTGGGCGLNRALSDLFLSQGVHLEPYTGQALSYKVIEDWASLGIGAGILPLGKLTQENRDAYPLFLAHDLPASFDYEWVWMKERGVPDHLKLLLDYIEQTVPALVEGRAEQSGVGSPLASADGTLFPGAQRAPRPARGV